MLCNTFNYPNFVSYSEFNKFGARKGALLHQPCLLIFYPTLYLINSGHIKVLCMVGVKINF